MITQTAKPLAFKNSFRLTLLKWLSLKDRYLFTRHNMLRLRYVFLFILPVFCITAFLTFGNSPQTNAIQIGHLEPIENKDTALSTKDDNLISDDILALLSGDIEPSKTPPLPRPAAKKIPAPIQKTFTLQNGDTLAGVLQGKLDLSGRDSFLITEAMRHHYNPRQLKPGQKLLVTYQPGSETDIHHIDIQINPLEVVRLTSADDGSYEASLDSIATEKHLKAARTSIITSLYGSAEKAGFPAQIIGRAIQIYSWDVDFQRDIRSGDQFEVLYETFKNEAGETLKTGNIVYAKLTVNGRPVEIYRYETKNGDIDYFLPNGESVRKALMKTPVDGARLSSGYGMRKHPVLGYNKMHKGLDFAAPTGTPIYTAGDGVVERASAFGAYGNYVRIRHNSTLKTAYAHLHKYGKNIRPGTHVKQGQVIGYIGSTGRSTGPHLHYEVIVNGAQVNPRSVDLPQGEILNGTELANFKAHVEGLRREYASLMNGAQYANIE